MSLIFKLYRLQQVDTQLDSIRTRLREIEVLLKDDRKLQQAVQRASITAQDLAAAETTLRSAEAASRGQRTKIEQSEASLYGGRVTNPKELQDLQNEVAALKRYLSVLEDRQLEAMLSLDDARDQNLEAQSVLEREQAEKQNVDQQLTTEYTTLQRDLERLSSERAAASSGVPPEELSQYESLRALRQGLAVSKVSDRTCTACGSTLSAALMGEARSPNKISRCDFCGRILYAS